MATLADLLPPDQRELFLSLKASPAESSISEPVPMAEGEDNSEVDISEHLSKAELAALFAAYDEDDWVQVNDLLNTAEKRYGDTTETKVEKTPKEAAGAERLKRYWSIGGVGGAKIRWGERNAWYRCVTQTSKYLGDRAKGFCSNLALRNTGERPHPYPGGPNAASRAAEALANAAQAAGIEKDKKSIDDESEEEKGHRARREGTAPASHRERRAGRVPGSQLVTPFPSKPEIVSEFQTVQVDPPVEHQMAPGSPVMSHRSRRGRPHGLTGSSKAFDPEKHPRSKDGEFINIGAIVSVIDKDGSHVGAGSVTAINSDGTVSVDTVGHDGAEGHISHFDPSNSRIIIPAPKLEAPKTPKTPTFKPGDRITDSAGKTGVIAENQTRIPAGSVPRRRITYDDGSEGVMRVDALTPLNDGKPKPKKPKAKRAPTKAAMKPQTVFPDTSTLPEWKPKKGDRVMAPFGKGTIAENAPLDDGKYVVKYDSDNYIMSDVKAPTTPTRLTHVNADGTPVGDAIKGVKPDVFFALKGKDSRTGFNGRFDPKTLGPEEAKAAENQIRIEMTELPELRNTVSSITVIPHDSDDPAGNSVLGATIASSIHLYSEPMNVKPGANDDSTTPAMIKKWTSTGATNVTDQARHTVVHEMGHSVAARMSQDSLDQARRVLTNDPTYVIGPVDTSSGMHSVAMNMQHIARDLSNYGASSQNEMMAECWAEYRLSSRPRPLAAKVGAIMQAHMNDEPAVPKDRIGWPEIDENGDPVDDPIIPYSRYSGYIPYGDSMKTPKPDDDGNDYGSPS